MQRRMTILSKLVCLGSMLLASDVLAQQANQNPSLSQRLAQLRQSWSQDEKQAPHIEPERSPSQRVASRVPPTRLGDSEPEPLDGPRFSPVEQGSQDLFDSLGDSKGPRLNGPPATRVAARAVADGEQPTFDIAESLGGGSMPMKAAPTPAVATHTPAKAAAPLPVPDQQAPTPRRPSFGDDDMALDIISSTASSRDTRGPGRQTDDVAADGVPDFEHTEKSVVPEVVAVEPELPAEPESDEPALEPLPTTDEAIALQEQSLPVVESPAVETEADALPATSSVDAEHAFEDRSDMQPGGGMSEEVWVTSPPTESRPASNFRGAEVTEPSLADQSQTSDNMLVSEQLPLIDSRVYGPSKILIGHEARYRVVVQNRGDAAANQLTTVVDVPAWAEVVHMVASSGTVQRPSETERSQSLSWTMASLEAGQSQTVEVVLVPKTSQPLNLGVTWRHAPVATNTLVEVQEPKLAMAISGPDEVFFGRPQTYRLSLSNPGTGPAENIVVQLMPPGGGQAVSSYRVDSLSAGEAKVVDIEITAREAGELVIKAVAAADGNLRSESSQEIFCRQAELAVDWRGPERKFAGTQATYYFRVRNPGTASAEQVALEVNLPVGFEFASASEGHQFDAASRRVQWKVGTLRPGDDCFLELRGTVNMPGANDLRLLATNADGDVQDTKVASTEVVALADLKLDVADPKGPVPVGGEVEYEIIVTNRGRSVAEAVNIVGLFSAGIEPLAADGAEATISDGRVGFRTIGALPAGQKVRLKIRAKAHSAGTHLFRAEVICKDLDIKLAAEETTRFYQDESAAEGQVLESASRASRFE